jgi:hypothetical protein
MMCDPVRPAHQKIIRPTIAWRLTPSKMIRLKMHLDGAPT